MSGTSMDGIDAALVDLSADSPLLLNTHLHPWPEPVRHQLRQAAQGELFNMDAFAQLDAEVGVVLAEAALQVIANYADPTEIRAIGSHGQTLAHNPNARVGYSLQIGDPNVIAEHTGIATVADFRGRDIAAGGQGAPLVPAFHQAVFHHPAENRVILNIGGIANLTGLPANGSMISGFDTGPGNCLMDVWVGQHLGQRFDHNGDYARQGHSQPALLNGLLADEYFEKLPPKSTGTDYFSLTWLQKCLSDEDFAPEDVQAALLQLTAQSIAQAIERHYPETNRVLACGGGIHNGFLMTTLAQYLHCPIDSTANYGAHPDWVEAMAFAWLAQQHLHHCPGNAPGVTGAGGARVLGALYPAT